MTRVIIERYDPDSKCVSLMEECEQHDTIDNVEIEEVCCNLSNISLCWSFLT